MLTSRSISKKAKWKRLRVSKQMCRIKVTLTDLKAFKKCRAGNGEVRFNQAGRRFLPVLREGANVISEICLLVIIATRPGIPRAVASLPARSKQIYE